MRLDPITLINPIHLGPIRADLLCQQTQYKNSPDSKLYEFALLNTPVQQSSKVMLDDHSKLVPLLPIPNRTVKQLRADDSAGSRVKVGHRQAITAQQRPPQFYD